MEKNEENAKYIIEWNTGDYMWDNYPNISYCWSLKELIDELDLTDEQIKELSEYGYVYDESKTVWRASEL